MIECGQEVAKDEMFDVKVGLGKEIAHPNTTEHHIRWISLYFKPDDLEKVFQIGHYELSAHGEEVSGPNEGPVYTHHQVITTMKTSSPGTIYALALCNIHGLWENSLDIKLKCREIRQFLNSPEAAHAGTQPAQIEKRRDFMAQLNAEYMGIPLKNPLIAGASHLIEAAVVNLSGGLT